MERPHRSSRLALTLALPMLLLGAMAVPTDAAAASEPNGNASCMGLELASISPPGSSGEEPGGARQFTGEVKWLASTLGVRPGALFSFIAQLDAGSHAECDEALEG